MFLKFIKKFCRYLNDHRHTLVSILPHLILENLSDPEDSYKSVHGGAHPNSFVVHLFDGIPVSTHRNARKLKVECTA